MKKNLTALFLSMIAILLMAVPTAFAHHSFSMFDLKKEITIEGTVTEFQWTNPHVWIQMDSTGKDGKVTHWSIEAGAPSVLMKAGWKRKTLATGDKIKLIIHPLRNGSPGGALVTATLPDGTVLKESVTNYK